MLFLPSQNEVSCTFIVRCSSWMVPQRGECGFCSCWGITSFILGEIWTPVLQDLMDWDPQDAEPLLYACCCQDVPVGQKAQAQSQVSRSNCHLMQYIIVIICWLGSAQSWEVCMRPPSSAGKLGMGCFCENDKTITSSSLKFLFLLLIWDLENKTIGEGIEKCFYTSLSLNF